MKPQLIRVGEGAHPVVVIDDFHGRPGAIVAAAAALAPFPADHGTYYPGSRRIIAPADRGANAYVERMLDAAAPFIAGAFDFMRFDLLEASFSMVTAPPERLGPAQRAPHFDSTDPAYLALLHYLSPTAGTAFYRQRLTGIEVVTEANHDAFVAAARQESPHMRGYIRESNEWFEQIGAVEGLVDRLAIYQGGLLHSGIIPEDMDFSDDPARGRLTANIFIRGY
jgi:hypothetical protein